jgi:protein SCO1
MQLTRTQKWLWVVTGLALAGYFGLTIWTNTLTRQDTTASRPADGTDVIQPRFQLTDHTGARVTDATWRGQWLMVFFGFTNCPDICPTTLGELAAVMDGLGADAPMVKPLFISIDPERDRVADMAEYVEAFHPAITGLTGTDTDIAAAADNFRAFYGKQEEASAPDGYVMAHTSVVYLVSPEGRFERVYSYGTAAEDILEDIQRRL